MTPDQKVVKSVIGWVGIIPDADESTASSWQLWMATAGTSAVILGVAEAVRRTKDAKRAAAVAMVLLAVQWILMTLVSSSVLAGAGDSGMSDVVIACTVLIAIGALGAFVHLVAGSEGKGLCGKQAAATAAVVVFGVALSHGIMLAVGGDRRVAALSSDSKAADELENLAGMFGMVDLLLVASAGYVAYCHLKM